MTRPSPRIARLDDAVARPWRNGGGVARDLLAWPADGSDGSDSSEDRGGTWRVRISAADIERDGPFSSYDGVSRWFAVLEGAGVRLEWPGGRVRELEPRAEPVAFDGADPPVCRLLAGPTRDLNFMVRGDGVASMRRAEAGSTLDAAVAWRGFYAHDAAQLAIEGEPPLAIEPGTLVWSDEAAPRSWTLVAGGRAWWMLLES